MADGHAHTGRGGAGNVSSKSPPPDEESFRTPVIKTPHYTTGRGGSGNIVSNDNPDNARLAQDVSMPASVAKEPAGVHLTGRGGGGNIAGDSLKRTVSKDKPQSKERSQSRDGKARTGSGVFDRAKELIGLKK